jgi:flavin reductase (DIM6/NTAB) family NADH-FMN oxidoreductase RutF
VIFDYEKISSSERTNLIYSTVIPRPIAWIITERDGIVNVAPFSFFAGISTTPPILIVAIGKKRDGSPKDTLRNILQNGKATICVVPENMMEKMVNSSEPLSSKSSEAEHFNIEVERIFKDFPPSIKGISSAMFCTFHSRVDLESDTTPILLKIEKQFVRDENFKDGFLDLDVIGRVGKGFAKLEKL